MSELFNLLWYFCYRVLYYFFNPGGTISGINFRNITIPKLITNNPILLLFFGLSCIMSVIYLFNRLRRIM